VYLTATNIRHRTRDPSSAIPRPVVRHQFHNSRLENFIRVGLVIHQDLCEVRTTCLGTVVAIWAAEEKHDRLTRREFQALFADGIRRVGPCDGCDGCWRGVGLLSFAFIVATLIFVGVFI